MLYLFTHIFLYMVAAAFFGWLIARSIAKSREKHLLDDHKELESKYASLEAYRDRINRDYFSLKEQEHEKSQEIVHLKKLASDTRVKSETFALENNDIQTKFELLNERSSSKNQEAQEEHERYKQEISNNHLKIHELVERLTHVISEKKVLEHQVTQLSKQTTTSQLDNEFHTLNSDRKKLSAQVDLLLSERSDYEERVHNLIEEQSELSERIRELKENETGSEKLEELTTQIIDIRNERDDYFHRLRTISNVVDPCA